jgi:hypothetical protein
MAYRRQIRRGLGTNTDCGPSPCGWSDYFWAGPDCTAWQQCQAQLNAAPAPASLDAQIAALPIASPGGAALNASYLESLSTPAPGPQMGAPNWWVLAAVAAGLVAFAVVRR